MTPPAAKASLADDLMDIFYAPGTVFVRREKSGFGVLLLVVSLIAAVFAFANRGVTSQIFEAEYDRRVAKMVAENPQLPAERLTATKGMQMRIQAVGVYIAAPISIVAVALALWLAALIGRARVTYAQAVLIVTLAFIPRQLGTLLVTVQTLVMDTSAVTDPFALTISPARWMDRETANPKVYAVMGTLDAFRIWTAALEGIGIAALAKVSAARGYAVTAAVFVVFSLAAMAFA
jgi:hypothetical protein